MRRERVSHRAYPCAMFSWLLEILSRKPGRNPYRSFACDLICILPRWVRHCLSGPQAKKNCLSVTNWPKVAPITDIKVKSPSMIYWGQSWDPVRTSG